MADAAFYMHIDGFDRFDKSVDFDRAPIRKAMRAAGRLIQREAKGYVSAGEISQPGAYPGKRRGVLSRSIKVKVSRSGFLVRVAPAKIDGMEAYYPAFLSYGVRRKPGVRRDKRSKGSAGWRVEPRGNYMIDAKDKRAAEINALLTSAFASSLRIK